MRPNLSGVSYLIAVLLSLNALAPLSASPISSPSALTGLKATTISFEDQAGHVGEEFGFGAGQPYAALGVTLFASVADVGIGSASGGISARSGAVYSGGNENSLSVSFSNGQRGIGFFYQDLTASSITVMAFGQNGQMLESVTLTPGTGYTGFLRDAPDIFDIRTFAPHATAQAAYDSRTYIDDLTFGSARHLRPTDMGASEVAPGSPLLILGLCARSPWLCHGVPKWPVVLWGPVPGAVVIAPLPRDPAAALRLAKMRSDADYRMLLQGLGPEWTVGVFDAVGRVAPFEVTRAEGGRVVTLHLRAKEGLIEELGQYFLAFNMTAKGTPGAEYPVTARIEIVDRPSPPTSR